MPVKKATKKRVTKKKVTPKISKKIVNKKTTKKKVVKKVTPKISKNTKIQKESQSKKRFARATKRKIKIVLNNILFFSVAMLIFLLLYSASGTLVFQNLFMILTICTGAIVMAFLIVLLIFVLLRLMNK